MLTDDGDIVRGLGFVALYAAYLEEQIENLLILLGPIEAYDEKKQRWPISSKIKQAIKLMERIDASEFPDCATYLRTCADLFEERNQLIHGRIYANFDRPDTLKSGRPNVPDRQVHSGELYKLANELDGLRSAVYAPMIFRLPRAVGKYLETKV